MFPVLKSHFRSNSSNFLMFTVLIFGQIRCSKNVMFTVLSIGQVTKGYSLLYSFMFTGLIRSSFLGHLNNPLQNVCASQQQKKHFNLQRALFFVKS